jgi:hypothetical protein
MARIKRWLDRHWAIQSSPESLTALIKSQILF